MAEVKFIDHQGIQVLQIIFPNGSSKEDVLENIEKAKQIISSQPPNSVYTMTCLGSFFYDTEIAKAFEEFITHNKPYVKAGAVLGVTGLKRALYNSFMYLAKRNIKVCDTEQEALEFLLADSKKT